MPSSTCNHHRSAFPRCRWEWIFFMVFTTTCSLVSEVKRTTCPKRTGSPDKNGDGVRFRIVPDKNSAQKVFVHPDVDLAFIASVISKDAYEGSSQFVSFTDESLASFFSKKRHTRSAANFKIANSTGRLAYYYGRDPMAMCKDPDLTGSLNHRLYMIYPMKPVSVDKKKLSGAVSNAKNKPDYDDDQLYVGELIYNASSMVRDDGVIIVLHHDSSTWDMEQLGKDYGLEFLMKVKFNRETFPDFSPRWGENDVKFDPTESSFYCFRVLKKHHRPPSIQMQPTDGSKNASQSHGETSRHGLQLLLETEKIALKSNLQKACISLEDNYMTPVTFSVVQKRQHGRFFPVRHGDIASTDWSGKVLPETVVDTKICHPTEFGAPKMSPLSHPMHSELSQNYL